MPRKNSRSKSRKHTYNMRNVFADNVDIEPHRGGDYLSMQEIAVSFMKSVEDYLINDPVNDFVGSSFYSMNIKYGKTEANASVVVISGSLPINIYSELLSFIKFRLFAGQDINMHNNGYYRAEMVNLSKIVDPSSIINQCKRAISNLTGNPVCMKDTVKILIRTEFIHVDDAVLYGGADSLYEGDEERYPYYGVKGSMYDEDDEKQTYNFASSSRDPRAVRRTPHIPVASNPRQAYIHSLVFGGAAQPPQPQPRQQLQFVNNQPQYHPIYGHLLPQPQPQPPQPQPRVDYEGDVEMEDVVKQLPYTPMTDADYAANHDCSICMNTVTQDGSKTICNHPFHTQCLRNWMARQSTCPNCRRILL